jgi:hypothetical protein
MRLFDSVSDAVLYCYSIKARRQKKAVREDEESKGLVQEIVEDIMTPLGLQDYLCFRHKNTAATTHSMHLLDADDLTGTATDDANHFLNTIGVGLPPAIVNLSTKKSSFNKDVTAIAHRAATDVKQAATDAEKHLTSTSHNDGGAQSSQGAQSGARNCKVTG